jgi:hypothetical protein
MTSVPRKRATFWIDDEQREGLKAVKERDGVLKSEQIRRAINHWLEKKGVKVKTARKRASTRGAYEGTARLPAGRRRHS